MKILKSIVDFHVTSASYTLEEDTEFYTQVFTKVVLLFTVSLCNITTDIIYSHILFYYILFFILFLHMYKFELLII